VVRDVESLVNPDNNITQDHDNLESEVEDIKASFRLVTSRLAAGTGAACVVCPHAEAGAEAEQERGAKQEGNLRPESAMPEFFQPRLSRYEDPTDCQEDREEGDEGIKSLAVEQEVAIYALRVVVEGVEALDISGNDYDKREDNEDVYRYESPVESCGPACMWMACSYNPLSEQNVDDEEQDYSRGNEDVGRNGYSDICRPCSPDDAHDHGSDTSHAEAEHHAGDDEFVASPLVYLKDGHMADGTDEEEEEEDCADGDIEGDGREAAQTCGGGWVGRFEVLLAHGGTVRSSTGVLEVGSAYRS